MSDKLKRLFIPGIIDAILPTVEWVQELLGGKVDKVTGKGLSTNDYTTADKQKLDGIEAGAQKNSVTEQTVSGWGFTKNTGTYSKPVGGIPASDLAPGVIPDVSGKADKADVYTKTEVDQKLVGAMDYKGTKATVSALPTSGNNTGDVWHIDADGSEWAWNGLIWEELGTSVDLSGYRTASAQDTIDAAQNTAIAAKYTKPNGGIPKTDLDSAVQTSLGKADTALQDGANITNNLGFCYVNVGAGQTTTELIGTNANYVPKNGGIVVGRFLVDVPSNATINISGKGAKAVYFRNSAITAGTIKSGDVAAFVYYPDRYYLISIDRWQTDIDAIKNAGYQTAQDVSLAILAADPPLELIRTYTCDGTETTTSAFYITEDDDGNAFRLKKLVMRVTLGTVSASGTFSANALSDAKVLAQAYSSYGASASGQRYELVCWQDSGYWRMEQFPFSSATGNIGYNHDYSFKDSTNQYLYIDRVRLTRAVPAGTVIELLGVPYDSNGIQPAESNSFGGGA